MRAAVVGFLSVAVAAAVGQLLATYLVNNVRPIRNVVGPL